MAAAEAAMAMGVALSPAARNCKCLIVESNELLQRLVHGFLTTLSIQHTQVFDGEHAVSACVQNQYDLIFLDLDAAWHGPVQTGLEAASNIRFQGLNTTTPVVGWTGSLELQQEQRAWTEAGVNDILLKPFNKENILQMINTWGAGNKIDPLPFDTGSFPVLELAELPPPSFVTSDIVRPKTARVLVVEDCTLTQHIMCTLLKKLTNFVQQAFDGEQAIRLCSETAFDIVFMDIHMPKVNGLEATHHVRHTSNLNKYTPIIAFTSTGTLEDYSVFGVNDLLQKPFTTESLSDKFDKWTPYSKAIMDITDGSFGASNQVEPHSDGLPQFSLPESPDQVPQVHVDKFLSNSPEAAALSTSPTTVQPAPATKKPAGKVKAASGAVAARQDDRKEAAGQYKRRKPSTIGHTAKEKMRRASIALSCSSLRTLVPSCMEADKATVFRVAAEYITYLRQAIPPQELERLDRQFVENLVPMQLEDHSSERMNELERQLSEQGAAPSTAMAAAAASMAVNDFSKLQRR